MGNGDRKRISSEVERRRSEMAAKNYAGVFVCDYHKKVPQGYFGRQLSEDEQSDLVKLVDGKFISFRAGRNK